jgi:hypothetical protein
MNLLIKDGVLIKGGNAPKINPIQYVQLIGLMLGSLPNKPASIPVIQARAILLPNTENRLLPLLIFTAQNPIQAKVRIQITRNENKLLRLDHFQTLDECLARSQRLLE